MDGFRGKPKFSVFRMTPMPSAWHSERMISTSIEQSSFTADALEMQGNPIAVSENLTESVSDIAERGNCPRETGNCIFHLRPENLKKNNRNEPVNFELMTIGQKFRFSQGFDSFVSTFRVKLFDQVKTLSAPSIHLSPPK